MDDALGTIEALKEKGHPLVYVGDVVGTGSSRKSATNSVLWHMGDDIPHIPNKRDGGFVLGGKIAPIFFNTMEDAGALPIECDVTKNVHGRCHRVAPLRRGDQEMSQGEVISEFELASDVILDEVRAGGRIPLIIGRGLTQRAREALGLGPSDVFTQTEDATASGARIYPCPKNGRKSLRGRGCSAWTILRAKDDDGRIAGHDGPHDPRRAQRACLSWLFG